MLIGQYYANIDSKRRVAVPAKFRQILGSKIIVARWYESCLVIVDQKNWIELLERLGGKGKVITSPIRDTDRFILGSAFAEDLDAQGRVVLPEALVKYAFLEKEVVFLGLGNRVEIWNKLNWEKQEEFISKNAAKFLEKLARDEGSEK